MKVITFLKKWSHHHMLNNIFILKFSYNKNSYFNLKKIQSSHRLFIIVNYLITLQVFKISRKNFTILIN